MEKFILLSDRKKYAVISITVLLSSLFTCCNKESNSIKHILPIITTPVVSEKCDLIIYGTNESNLTRPTIIEGYFTKDSIRKKKINVSGDFDINATAVSCDCKSILLTGNSAALKKTFTYLYDVHTEALMNVTEEKKIEFNSPVFSPVSNHISYLDKSQLRLINYSTFVKENIPNPTGIKFTRQVWSAKGRYIYLEDNNTNIWRYGTKDKKFNLLWSAPKNFSLSRMITVSENAEEIFYFISDHASDFIQVYKFGEDSTASLLFPATHDNYLFQLPLKTDTLYYKSNEDGVFYLKEYFQGKTKHSFNQADGEVMKYFPNKKGDIFYYADHKHPRSLYIRKNDQFESLVEGLNDTMPDPHVIHNKYGMINLVYFPAQRPKGWILWLHGGPNSQVLRSYEFHFSYFLQSGYGVIAINFPGSSGIGNGYEMEDKKIEDLLPIELASVKEDLTQVKNKFPGIGKVAIVGVSYGAILAHRYSQKHAEDVSHLVDFSGLGDFPGKEGIPVLYVYGKEDIALSYSRLDMINKDVKAGNGRVFQVEAEGHSILRLNNREAALQEIIKFLSTQ